MSIRVYIIDLDQLDVDDVKGSDDYSNEEFMNIAEEQGAVYTLKGFQNDFNYEQNISSFNCYLRFIDTEREV